MQRLQTACLLVLTASAIVLVLRGGVPTAEAGSSRKITCDTWSFEWGPNRDGGVEAVSAHAEAMKERLTWMLASSSAKVTYDRAFPVYGEGPDKPSTGQVGVICVAQ